MAEKLGLGFIDHGRFVKKQNVVIEAKLSCLPRIKEKVLDGKISHVSRFVSCASNGMVRVVLIFPINFSLKIANVFGSNRNVKTTTSETSSRY